MADCPRLIEHAFPLKQASLDSLHEKNVRHGHISTLHIWPARRPLAACRAALIATLLPDPSATPKPDGMSDDAWQKEIQRRRQELCEKIGGKVVKRVEKKKMPSGQTVERIKELTEGGILHWLEEEPLPRSGKKWREWKARRQHFDSTLEWFRQEIRKAYGGRAPKVLDPFAGGGAIPLEAMRLGCEATAVDINPVAWFILKCTLEYPQRLAGQIRPLPDFILKNKEFMRAFLKAKGLTSAQIVRKLRDLGHVDQGQAGLDLKFGHEDQVLQADLAWHVRAWGQWVLDRARRELAQYYPAYADFEPIKKDHIAYEHQPMRLVPLKYDGTPDIQSLNAEFTEDYLADKRNPRWVAKPTVAYLWARTVTCKNCRATVPLLKTRWLCKKANKRVLLTMEPNADRTGIVFGIEQNAPIRGGNTAQRREYDKRLGEGTMTRAGVRCPCCSAITTGEDLRLEGQAGRLGTQLVAVVTEGESCKEYRYPTVHELAISRSDGTALTSIFESLPSGDLTEPVPEGGTRSAGGSAFTVYRYGIREWRSLFTTRQRLCLGTLVGMVRGAASATRHSYPDEWRTAVHAFLAAAFDLTANRSSSICTWTLSRETIRSTFSRFALPMSWDIAEAAMMEDGSGGFSSACDWVARYVEHATTATKHSAPATVMRASAIAQRLTGYELIVTDPPYYDAIPYSDLMDFFLVWLRRTLIGGCADWDAAFDQKHGPKWDPDLGDGELVDDSSRHGGDKAKSKAAYEVGMTRAFEACHRSLKDGGRMVVVFAHKQADAWETLAGAIIRSGFVVDGSWPIQTEMSNRTRALVGAALASSVWLVCKKRTATAGPGWDNNVLEEMKVNIAVRLREFWDAGIRGPDFVWAATGPALEAYSKHPVVRKANEPNATMSVGEFLNHVRRMVVDYVVGQVLTGEQGSDLAAADRLDEVTAYYLLHRHDFGMDEAPVGACILYATACSLSDAELDRTWDILSRTGGDSSASCEDDSTDDSGDSDSDGDGDAEPPEDTAGGSKVKLKPWNQRRGKSMGYEAPEGRVVPLIDRIHRVMHLWQEGEVQKVDEYLDEHGLRRHELFKRVVQSLIELSANSERSLLESISNHIGAKGTMADANQMTIGYGD
jgi:putative DNA methylase